MIRSRSPALILAASVLAVLTSAVLAVSSAEARDKKKRAAPPPVAAEGGPTELVHVPSDQLDVLLRADSQGIVLRYAEYERLMAAAQARAAMLKAQPPVDGTLVSCEGTLDLRGERAATLALNYVVEVLAEGPRSVSFPLRNLAFERLLILDEDGAPSGRYEEWKGRPRLRFEAPGRSTVKVVCSAAFRRRKAQRYLDLWLPPASAMSLALLLPAGMEGFVLGEGPATKVRAPSDGSLTVRARPSRSGRLRIGFAPAAKGTDDGPAILDTHSTTLHTVGDGLVHSRVILQTDVFRTAVDQFTLAVPADLAVRALEGKGVTGFRRSADGTRITVSLAKPVLGRVVLTVEGERPYTPAPRVVLPHVVVDGAVRDRASMAVQFGKDVRVRGFHVEGGRRLAASRSKGQQHLLRYELTRATGVLAVDLEAGAVRTDAVSTYYLNLAEAGKTLIVTMTYRVLEGTVFALRPRMPGGYELRTITINGRPNGFNRDLQPDGTLEIALARGVPAGGEISLAATLEQSQADWVANGKPVRVPLAVPSAGATREEGLLGIGADAAFQVLEAAHADLIAVGAADLTARGISAAGLVYGYRLDGPQPAVTFNVRRHEPLLEARVVTTLLPAPRRLDVLAVVAHRIQRAGVRTLLIDVPAWPDKEQVRFESPFVRGAVMLAGAEKPADVPSGYERWRVDLNQRVIGRHVTVVRYHDDLGEENWSISPKRALGVRVPLGEGERFVVVQRAEGLEVRLTTEGTDLRAVELSELPAAAAIDPGRVLEALRLANGGEGVGVSVQKHGGAAVLDAVATQVRLATAVAREGILRSRALVHLFNVDRQFLRVTLPPRSDLIGAVVGSRAVKVLTGPTGVLMIPIPTARARGEITLVALTYETNLGEEVGSHVRVPSPILHDLEVLETSHRIAFDPDFEIGQVGGSYGRTSAGQGRGRTPWIASLWPMSTVDSAASGAAAPEVRNYSPFSSPVDFDTLQQNPTFQDGFGDGERAKVLEAENLDLRQALEGSLEDSRVAHAQTDEAMARRAQVEAGMTELRRSARQANRDGALPALQSEPRATRSPAGAVAPGMRQPGDSSPPAPPPLSGPATAGDGGGGPARAPASKPHADPSEDGRPGAEDAEEDESADSDDVHEGQTVRGKRPGARGPRGRRKGLLSLDVPVVLGPNVLMARRLGQGGFIEIDLATRSSSDQKFHLLMLILSAVGLLAGVGARRRKWLVLLGGAGVAILTSVLLGTEGNTLVVALVNALTLLAGIWLVRALVHWWIRRPAHDTAAAAGKAATTAALLLALGLLLTARVAHADEPRPPIPNVEPPKKVFVPYDPARPADVQATDRVFLPLKTYLRLFKAAHPESDPELVRLGRMVTIVDADYDLTVARAAAGASAGAMGAMATGSARWRFAKRGQGTVLVAWPVGGLAVTAATLDGKPVRLLLEKGIYRVAVTEPGDHRLVLRFRAPIVQNPDGRHLAFHVPPFGRAALKVHAPDFEGHVRVNGAGRVETAYESVVPGRRDCRATAWLGRRTKISVALLERTPEELPATVRTRAESRAIHSVRDAGTETQTDLTLFVLQGRAPFVDFALPAGVRVLEAKGPQVVRWEVLSQPAPRVRLTFNAPVTGALKLSLRTFRASATPERVESLADLSVLGTTGESGQVIVNADPSMRVEILAKENLFRIKRPSGKGFAGLDGRGRVMGAWRFAARPSRLEVGTRRIAARVDAQTDIAVLFGDDRIRTTIMARVTIEARAPVGTIVFDLPGDDEVRTVQSAGLDTWWLDGEKLTRRLHLRFRDMRTRTLAISVRLERRLGGDLDNLSVPRMALRGARRDHGRLALFTLSDVELKTGSVAGLRPLPPSAPPVAPPDVDGARPVHAYAWDAPLGESLPVGLREPELEAEATVITVVAPGEHEHRVNHLVLFEVRRGATDRLRFFVPDGGEGERAALGDVVTTRDVRELRRERVTRKGADGADVSGTLYDIRLQSERDGLIEVAISQVWRSPSSGPRPVRLVRPEGVATTHWFSLVRKFLDGEVQVGLRAGKPDTQVYASLPFVPAQLREGDVYRSFASRTPYILEVGTVLRGLVAQATAVVQSAEATVVLGRDGMARIRVDYRVFNRSRQFLRLRLPSEAVLFGATTNGSPVKPLAGKGGSILLPIRKVPLGGNGYPVSLLYRARAGADLDDGGTLQVLLPEVLDGVHVDRTVMRLHVPEGYDYDFESSMTSSDKAGVAAQLADVAIREARSLLQLAETGTLEQRFHATQNGLALLAIARKELGQAKDTRMLAGELNSLSQQLGKNSELVQEDMSAAVRGSQQVALSNEQFASNARNIVQLDDVTNGLEDAGKNKAGWVVNPVNGKVAGGKRKGAAGDAGAASARDEYAGLQDRLAKGLKKRSDRERRKNFQYKQALQNEGPPHLLVPGAGAGGGARGQSLDTKQVAWLNDAVRRDQVRNRQLGAVDASLVNTITQTRNTPLFGSEDEEQTKFLQDVGVDFRGLGQVLELQRRAQAWRNYGLTSSTPQTGAGGQAAGRNWEAEPVAGLKLGYSAASAAGTYFAGRPENDFRARTENVFDGSLGVVLKAEARGKIGKMGVDVALPLTGKVYYFRSLGGGAPVRIEAAQAGSSQGGRVALLLLILAAAAVAGSRLRRRFA